MLWTWGGALFAKSTKAREFLVLGLHMLKYWTSHSATSLRFSMQLSLRRVSFTTEGVNLNCTIFLALGVCSGAQAMPAQVAGIWNLDQAMKMQWVEGYR